MTDENTCSWYIQLCFFKDLGLIVIAILFLYKQISIYSFKYEMRYFYGFTLRNIVVDQYHIYRK